MPSKLNHPAKPTIGAGPVGHRLLAILGPAVAVLLAGCQVPPGGAREPVASLPRERPAAAGPISSSGCPDGQTARLSDGLEVAYVGADPKDRRTCLVSWEGKTHRFVLGVLPKERGRRVREEEQQAIHDALLGPVGTKTEFEDKDATLWGAVTVEHVDDPVLVLETGPRRTVQLRIIRHDAHGRPQVRQVTMFWVDRLTGIVLQSQVVDEMENGQQMGTNVWRVERLG